MEGSLKVPKQPQLGDNIYAPPAGWSFKGVETFAGHVRRSVPLYDEGHDLICRLSDYFIQKDSIAYDLGAKLAKLATEAKQLALFVGVDQKRE